MILSPDDTNAIEHVCAALRGGYIIALPTDTVYGFAVDGMEQEAVDTLARLKERDAKPFVFFIKKERMPFFADITCSRIVERFIPGAVTVILKKKKGVDLPYVTGTIGIRIPDTRFILTLLDAYDRPLAVTSANRSGETPYASPFEIAEKFTGIRVVVNGGTLASLPSTVCDCTKTPLIIERKGAVSIVDIEQAYNDLIRIKKGIRFNVLFVCTGNSCRSPMAEAILRTLVREDHCEIRSAGTLPGSGLQATDHARTVARRYGGTLAAHRSQPVTPSLIMWADEVFTMEQKHLEYLRHLVPTAQNKLFLLTAYPPGTSGTDIADPVGKDLIAYQNTAQEMLPFLRAIARDVMRRYEANA